MLRQLDLGLLSGNSVQSIDKWDFNGADTQYSTHALHAYLASMIPQIPCKLFAMYATPSTRILDPFVGGGAVVVEAYLADLASTGIDVNPLAVIITKAKTTPLPAAVLLNALTLFDRLVSKVRPDFPLTPTTAHLDYWFKPYTHEPLARIRATIRELVEEADVDYREKLGNLLACVFSHTVRGVSLTYRGEVRLRRLQGQDFERFNPDVIVEFRKRLLDAFGRVSRLPENHPSPVIYEGDAQHIEAPDGAFDLVVTSPPYGDIRNTIPYDQFSKNMLYWLGDGDQAIARIKARSLGAPGNGNGVGPRSPVLRQAISSIRKPNLVQDATRFYNDYGNALIEIARVTYQRIVMVIGHRILDGVLIDNASITTDILGDIGWRLEHHYLRRIRKKRLNSKMGFGHNAQGGTIDVEQILVYIPAH